MEKSISVFIAIVLLGGSGTISNLCPDNYQIGVQSACIALGALAAVFFIMQIQKERNTFLESIKNTEELMNDRVNQLIGQYTNNFLQLSEKIDGTNSSLKTIGCGEDSIKTEIEKLQEQYTDSFQQLYQKLDNTNSFLENIVEVIEDEENTIKNENGKISKLLSGIKEIENE